jgi:glutamyl-Q tRNA(Asp) synthetase
MTNSPPIFRFAPSPNGELHLGHALSALIGYEQARSCGGRFLLRIEDIDTARSRPQFVDGIFADLAWLGITWEEPVVFQSERMPAYRAAVERLQAMGLLYPCFATRAEIEAAAVRDARELADDGTPQMVSAHPERWGDAVIVRKDTPTSYHLAVVVDDAWQDVTIVTRGRDLYAATDLHRLLQVLLDLPAPVYHHHRLVTDADGRKLAKSARDTSLRSLRKEGATPADIRRMVGLA